MSLQARRHPGRRNDGELKIELFGELSALLALGQNRKSTRNSPRGAAMGASEQDLQVTVVAGVGNQRYFGLTQSTV